MKRCPKCNNAEPETAKFCSVCGGAMDGAVRYNPFNQQTTTAAGLGAAQNISQTMQGGNTSAGAQQWQQQQWQQQQPQQQQWQQQQMQHRQMQQTPQKKSNAKIIILVVVLIVVALTAAIGVVAIKMKSGSSSASVYTTESSNDSQGDVAITFETNEDQDAEDEDEVIEAEEEEEATEQSGPLEVESIEEQEGEDATLTETEEEEEEEEAEVEEEAAEEEAVEETTTISKTYLGLTITTDYILANSNTTYISESDLKGMSAEELKLARNEIYARHGRTFKDADLQAYFNSCSWYSGTISPDNFNEKVFNDYEIKNLAVIRAYEKSIGVNQ